MERVRETVVEGYPIEKGDSFTIQRLAQKQQFSFRNDLFFWLFVPRSHISRAPPSGSMGLLDQLTFYGSYHRDTRNKAIHLVCVPLIAWSVLVICCELSPVVSSDRLTRSQIPEWAVRFVPTSWASILVLAYFTYYFSLDQFAGITWLVCVGVLLRASACWFRGSVGEAAAWRWALGAHLAGWLLQIYPGHYVFEKRKPAICDSVFQSLVLAPLFVWMDVLFTCGYRPGLREDLKRRVALAVVELDAKAKEFGKKLR